MPIKVAGGASCLLGSFPWNFDEALFVFAFVVEISSYERAHTHF